MYHIFFIHPSVDECLGCFHVLAIVKRAAVNTGVHASMTHFKKEKGIFISLSRVSSWNAYIHFVPIHFFTVHPPHTQPLLSAIWQESLVAWPSFVCTQSIFLVLILSFKILITSEPTLVVAEFLIYPHMLLISFSLLTMRTPGSPMKCNL